MVPTQDGNGSPLREAPPSPPASWGGAPRAPPPPPPPPQNRAQRPPPREQLYAEAVEDPRLRDDVLAMMDSVPSRDRWTRLVPRGALARYDSLVFVPLIFIALGVLLSAPKTIRAPRQIHYILLFSAQVHLQHLTGDIGSTLDEANKYWASQFGPWPSWLLNLQDFYHDRGGELARLQPDTSRGVDLFPEVLPDLSVTVRLAKLPHLSAAVQVDILKNAGILDEVEALMRVGRAAAGVVTD